METSETDSRGDLEGDARLRFRSQTRLPEPLTPTPYVLQIVNGLV